MKLRALLVSVGLVSVLTGAAVAPQKASAQSGADDEGKRVVRVRVMPEYPPLARQMMAHGRVKIQATVSADGRVVATKVIGGSPLLINAALDAVKKWRYEPGPKETTEPVEFSFQE